MRTLLNISGLLDKLGGLLLVVIMLLTVADVVGGVFDHPVYGVEEIVGLMTAVLLAFALPSTQLRKGHVGVDLFFRLLSPSAQARTDRVLNLAGTLVFALITWQCVVYGWELGQSGEVSSTVGFPVEYLLYAMSVACLVVTVIMFAEFVRGKPFMAVKGH